MRHWWIVAITACIASCSVPSTAEPPAGEGAAPASVATSGLPGAMSEAAIAERLAGFESWIEIDLDALGANLDAIRRHTRVQVMPVVKNNAYGHGLLPVTAYLASRGIERVFVAKYREAVAIAESGIPCRVVNMGPLFSADQFRTVAELGIIQTVFDDDVARRLNDAAVEAGTQASVFIKVDTGLRRVGVAADAAVAFVEGVASLPGLTIDGMFSTFTQTPEQDAQALARFLEVESAIRAKGIDPGLRSMASSDAMFHAPQAHLDLVRPGMSLYGVYPEDKDRDAGVALTQVLTMKARIEQVKWVHEGDSVTYWGRFVAPSRMQIATIHAGFFDGLPRELQNAGSVAFGGAFRPMIGSVSLNHVIVDVTGTEARPGDVVEIIGREGANSLRETARTANWMVYSLLNHLNAATPRVYVEGGRPVALLD